MIIKCQVCSKDFKKVTTQKICSVCREEYYYNYRKKWYYSNHEENKEIKKNKRKEFRLKNPERTMFIAAKNRAKEKNLDFNLELSDILIPEFCPILEVQLVPKTEYAPSLDRINPIKGYVKGNVQVISRKANIMKNNATKEELVKFAEWVKKVY